MREARLIFLRVFSHSGRSLCQHALDLEQAERDRQLLLEGLHAVLGAHAALVEQERLALDVARDQRRDDARARSAQQLGDGMIAGPRPSAARTGAPKLGWITAAACSISPADPTIAALP